MMYDKRKKRESAKCGLSFCFVISVKSKGFAICEIIV